MQQEQIDSIIQKHLSGQISEAENRYLQDWLKADEHNQRHYAQVEEVWLAAMDIDFSLDPQTNSEWSKLMGKIEAEAPKSTLKVASKKASPSWWKYAAAALVVLSLGTVWFFLNPTSEQLAEQWVVPYGQQKEITLPDGTVVSLNAGSELAIYEGFNDQARHVKLNGEAYFDVHSDSLRPFLINVDGLATVEVLGTAFNLSAYANEAVISLDVTEGKVAFSSLKARSDAIYIAGQAGEINRQSGSLTEVPFQAKANAWKDGQLLFFDTPLTTVLQRLERHFDVKITNESGLAKESYNSSFDGESIEEIMTILSATFDLKYTKNGKEIRLYR